MAFVTQFIGTKATQGVINRGKKMDALLSRAVRDSLAELERDHKKNQIKNKGGSRDAPVPGKWTTRTGELRKSFHRAYTTGDLEGAYGSDLERSRVIEEGGTIKPKGTFLAIPTKHAPKKVWPRYVEGLVFIQSLKGQPLLVKPDDSGTGFKVYYILKKQVKLSPRPTLANAVAATEKSREKRFNDIVDKEIWGRN